MCPRFLPFAAAATLALAGCSSDRATAVPDGLQVRVTSRTLEGTPPPPTITARGDSVVVEAYLFISSCYRTDFAAGRVSKTVVVTVTSHVPFVAIAQGRNHLAWREIGWLRPAIGIAAFVVLLAAHPWLFGVSPL